MLPPHQMLMMRLQSSNVLAIIDKRKARIIRAFCFYGSAINSSKHHIKFQLDVRL